MMNWVERAKKMILSVRAYQSTNRETTTPVSIQWHHLPPLQAAINEALTGLPDCHPAALAFAEAVQPQHYLVIAGTSAEAYEIHAALGLLAPEAKATVRSLETDRIWIERLGAGVAASIQYDAVFLHLAGNAPQVNKLLNWLRSSLEASGRLWLCSRARPFDRPSQHMQRLLEIVFQYVPSRWRTSDGLQAVSLSSRQTETTDWVDALLCADFEIVSRRSLGGPLLGPLLEYGAISSDIASDPEGCALLHALYRLERILIDSGEIAATDFITIARLRRPLADRVNDALETQLLPLPDAAKTGISGEMQEWIKFNLGLAMTSARAADYAAPFPPINLMYHTTGLQQDRDFAQHGADILTALSAASPKPLGEFTSMLDFGVGVGRVARYYKGFSGRYVGADIDEPNLGWVAGHLPWVETVLTEPAAPLPFEPATFDGVVSISVFTHIDRETTEFYVDELHRLTRPGALLFLTLHGDQALNLALSDAEVGRLIGISPERLEQARGELAKDGFHFAEQYTHLTRTNYRYGTTFVSRQGAEAIFGRRFTVVGFVPGAIHSFQDLIVLEHP